ncbi:thiamine phosphate synthase [Endozoicomonas sp. SM1973]|uniref:Thiamine-phosphate synthase n=1 Tax=Spartinivicinus marinus TaxID=2994442 RepID=A0A853I3C5_9GAMM|nr:thiamine phosphate synthase [Spartinivicinus marinus]MCX4025993.1 thiamine phosphate synthase [Spartinivicinus marinus]NYZ67893.1 thiamine phosphate synthase [Spartinivicinus marinus]
MTTQLHGLYGITDSQLLPDTNALISAVEAALKGGMRILQYRDKSQNKIKRFNQASQLKALCQQYNACLIINDDIHLAAEVKADGVHLGQQDQAITQAREVLGKNAIIGVTCHDSYPLAEAAYQQGADYIALGRFFPSATKPNAPPASLCIIQQVSANIPLPIVAIGGITLDNASMVINAGAHLMAVIHGLFASDNIQGTAQQFTQLFSGASCIS